MIHFSIGLPSPLAGWCDGVLMRLAQLSGQPVTSITLPQSSAELMTMDQVPVLNDAALRLVESSATHIVAGCRLPDARLLAALTETGAPFVLALDDPRPLACDLGREAGASLAAATRRVANLCPLLMQYMALPGALLVRTRDADEKGAAAIAAMARHFGIALGDGQAQTLSDDMPFAGGDRPARDANEQRLLDGALGAYAAHFAGAPLGDIIWTEALFSLAYDRARAPAGLVPMRETDENRCLIDGPLLQLPPGAWVAQLALRVSPEGIGQTLILDLCSSRQLAAGKICPLSEDVATTEIPFTIDETTRRDIQLRIFAIRERLPGQLLFGHVLMHPVELHQKG